MEEIVMRTAPEYYESADKFMKTYIVQEFLLLDESNKHLLRPKNERICRFCGKSSSDTVFKDFAHLIPESLGNKLVFSDFECDNCNHLFGTYDNHLANFIGPDRPLN